MKSRLLLFILLLPNILFSEGSHEVWRDLPNHTTWLYLCNDLTGHCGGFGGDTRSNFAVYGCSPDERLYFITEDANEVVYLGFQGDPDQPGAHIVYRIRNQFGTIVQAEQNLPTAGTGYINNIGAARVGPMQAAGAGGYDGALFTPAAPGIFYVEFSIVDNGGNRIDDTFYMELFDITVYNTVTTTIEKGRLYSQSWQFYDGQPNFGNWDVNSSTFYIYSADSIITTVEFDEMEGRAWLMFCNQFGCQNTGNFVIDRMSLNNQQAVVPQYKIFLNNPGQLLSCC